MKILNDEIENHFLSNYWIVVHPFVANDVISEVWSGALNPVKSPALYCIDEELNEKF